MIFAVAYAVERFFFFLNRLNSNSTHCNNLHILSLCQLRTNQVLLKLPIGKFCLSVMFKLNAKLPVTQARRQRGLQLSSF